MDALEAFFNGDPIERTIISGGTTNGRVRMHDERPNYTEDKVPEKTKKYAEPFENRLKEAVWEVSVDTKCITIYIRLRKLANKLLKSIKPWF